MSSLDTPITQKTIHALGITTIRDLLFYFPFRFDDFTKIVRIQDLRANDTVTLLGTIRLIQNRRSWKTRKIVTEALLADESGEVKVIWFNQPFLIKNIRVGDTVSLSGKTNDNFYALQLVNPIYEHVRQGGSLIHTGGLVPVYSSLSGVSQKKLRTLIKNAIDHYGSLLVDFLPAEIRKEEHFKPLHEAIRTIHFPKNKEECIAARTRLAFDELLFLQLFIQSTRKEVKSAHAPAIVFDRSAIQTFLKTLPFSLTKGQRVCAWEILQDMAGNTPMNRLLEGDVGSGKTVIAAIAVYSALQNGFQAALMAPTEVLARQHFGTFISIFGSLPFACALLTSSEFSFWTKESGVKKHTTKKERVALLERIKNGEIGFSIGTHALLEDPVVFRNLGIAIIDEQHRFGVQQRKILRERNLSRQMPHLLSMTATPIPRSLALTLYCDLNVSRLEGMPQGRKKIITKITPQKYRDWVYEFIRKEIQKGNQAFIIFPLIDPSDVLGVRSVTEEYKRLSKNELASVRIGILHGKMKSVEKEAVMRALLNKEIDVIISTSVVEVGIDIKSATVMLIEGAERFGLAQLHQFRGRVGRSDLQSYCFLLPTLSSHEEKERLKIFASSNDGFYLAEKDLALRGEGDVLGLRQSGMPFLRVATLQDIELMKKARGWAEKIAPQINEYPLLHQRLKEIERDVHLE